MVMVPEDTEDAVFRAGCAPVHPEVAKTLGKLHFRHSFSQNVLEHSVEVAHLCGAIAGELRLDTRLAKRAGLLHDLGKAVEHEVEACGLKRGADAILVDFHAEVTSEKQAMGHFLDGRASCVVGTHTHTPTADDRILPKGTAYMTDAGMCGDYNSVLGMDADEPIHRFLTRIPKNRFEPSDGPATLCGLAVDIDDATGLARHTGALRLGGVLAPAEPAFWRAG